MTKGEAQAAYRAAWFKRCMSPGLDQQIEAERVMDAVQSQCVDGVGPGAEWDTFKATLPGYDAFWSRRGDEIERMMKRRFGL